jgi:hypothetical protein
MPKGEIIMSRSRLIQRTIGVGLAGALLMSIAGSAAAAPVLSSTAAIKSATAPMAVDAQWRGRWGGRGWRGGWGGAVAAGVIGGLALGAIASAPYSYYGYGPSYGYTPYYGYAPTYYGYYGAPYYGSGYGYYGRQRPW